MVNQGRACVIVTPSTHEPTHKTVWDIHTNGNVFPELAVWDVHKNINEFLGLTMSVIHTYGNVFSRIHRVGCTYLRK